MAPTREGNTRVSASKFWCFTFNNFKSHNFTCEEVGSLLSKVGKYHFGEEVGEKGTPHLQGFIQLFKKGRPSELVKIPEIHWEKTNGSYQQNINYTKKSGKVFTNMDIVKDPMDELEFLPWQKTIIDIISKEPDSRKIHWFWEEYGGVGKTTFSKHLHLKYNALYVCGKSSDIKYAITSLKVKPKIVILDITRSTEHQDKVSYQALEEVKNGIFFNTKYESGMCVFNTPHVIVFSNFYPNEEMLSKDRWDINNI